VFHFPGNEILAYKKETGGYSVARFYGGGMNGDRAKLSEGGYSAHTKNPPTQ